jgi:hypothetical protein
LKAETPVRKTYTAQEIKDYKVAERVHSILYDRIPDETLRKYWNKSNIYIRRDVLNLK